MKAIKRIILLAAFVLLSLAAHAQRFDWVKHYHGLRDDDYRSGIERMATDSEGNIYVMGRFTMDAAIDGEPFLPAQYWSLNNNMSLFVAKLSPDGTLLWHKAIYKQEYPNEARVWPIGMRLVGDTALMLMANFMAPGEGSGNCLYYLDTMITSNNGYPFPVDSSSSWYANGLITLDPSDGHLLEHHFLQRALIDTAGNVVRSNPNYPWWATSDLGASDFDVDSHGNIYMVRTAYDEDYVWCDTCADHHRLASPTEGSIGGIRILIDGVRWIDYTLPYATGRWNQQLLKFSPHLDTLLDATYLLRTAPRMPDTITDDASFVRVSSFNLHGDHLCLCLELCKDHDSAAIERSDTLIVRARQQHFRLHQDALLIYDTALQPQQLVQTDILSAYYDSDSTLYGGAILFLNTAYDADSNSLFLLGDVGTRNVETGTGRNVGYRGDSLALNNNFFFLRLNPQNGDLLSYGKAGTDYSFTQKGFSNIGVGRNRVFAVVRYSNSIFFGDTVFYTRSHNVNMAAVSALGLVQWDYAGHEVAFLDFHAQGNNNNVGPVALHDSSLYFSGAVFDGASFDSISLTGAHTLIGRYVDKSLSSPYVYDNRHADQHITWDIFSVNDTIYVLGPARTLNLNATASSGLPVNYRLSNDTVAHIYGSELYTTNNGVVHITASQPGNSYWNAAQPVEKILRVGEVEGYIVWTQPLEFTYSDTTIHLDAVFVFGDTCMSYSLPAANGVAELVGASLHTLHLLGPGTVDITAEACQTNIASPDGHFRLTRTLTVHPADVSIDEAFKAVHIVAYPNPTSGKLTVESAEQLVSAILTDMAGRREEVRLTPQGDGRYTLDLTSRPQATYLLTLTTASGQRHTVRLLKQSDIFGK